MSKHIGTVIQVMGPVLDIRFPDDQLPSLLSAIEVPTVTPSSSRRWRSTSATMWSAASP